MKKEKMKKERKEKGCQIALGVLKTSLKLQTLTKITDEQKMTKKERERETEIEITRKKRESSFEILPTNHANL